MAERKAALIGCRQGQWIRTAGMRRLKLSARVQRDVMIQVYQRRGDADIMWGMTFVGPGEHQLEDASWTRVDIANGPHVDALCLLVSAA